MLFWLTCILTFVPIGGIRFFWEHFSTTLGLGFFYQYYIPQRSEFDLYSGQPNLFAPLPYLDIAFNF
jgi:hypothetical protein